MIAAERLQAITEAAGRTLAKIPSTATLVQEAATRMLALGVPIADLCAWSRTGCQRPKPFGPESPTASHGLCDACKRSAFGR